MKTDGGHGKLVDNLGMIVPPTSELIAGGAYGWGGN